VGDHRLPAVARHRDPADRLGSRRFGAKKVYLVSLTLFTLGSALCGLAASTNELILFRVLQGVGGA